MDPIVQQEQADDLEADPVEWIVNRRRSAVSQAIQGLQESADDGARAMQLSQGSGVPAPAIYGDLDNFEQEHKANLTSSILHDNEFLRNYALSNPMAPIVSNNDWGNLHNLSGVLQQFAPIHSVFQKAVDAFKEAHGEGVGVDPSELDKVNALVQDPAMAGAIRNFLQETIGPGYEMQRLGGALLAGVGGGIGEVGRLSGWRGAPDFVEKTIQAGSDPGLMATMGPLGGMAEGIFARAGQRVTIADEIKKLANDAKHHVGGGEAPPPGVNPLADKVHAEQAKADIKWLDNAMKAAKDTETGETSPELLKAFIEQHTDAKIGIKGRAAAELYGDEAPYADDGKLGWVPGIQEQLALARDTGADVEIPLSDWLTKGQDIAKDLKDDIRVRPGGVTLNEAKEGWEPTTAKPIENPVDAVRQSAGGPRGWEAAEGETDQPKAPNLIPEEPSQEPFNHFGLLFQSEHTFIAKDLIPKLNFEGTPKSAQALVKFFGGELRRVVGNTPIHILSHDDILKAFEKEKEIFGDSKSFIPGGWFDPNQGHIVLDKYLVDGTSPEGTTAVTVLHELEHAVSSKAIDQFPDLRNAIEKLMDETRKYFFEPGDQYGYKEGLMSVSAPLKDHAYAWYDAKEFMAETKSKPELQRLLADVPVSKELSKTLGLGERAGTIWQKFRELFKELYRRMIGKVPDDTVLDAIFKISEHIEEANKILEKEVRGVQPSPTAATVAPEDKWMYDRAKAFGMNKDISEKYVEKLKQQQAKDAEHQLAQGEKYERLKQTKEWKDNWKPTREDVRSEIRNRPDIAADIYLRTGELYGSKPGALKLGRDKVDRKWVQRLDPSYFADIGASADDLAGLFGYHSGQELLRNLGLLNDERKTADLTPAAHLRSIVDRETEREMRSRFGDLESNILEAAKDHVLSPTELDISHQELVAVAQKSGMERYPYSVTELRQMVKEELGGLNNAIPTRNKYLQAVGNAGRDFEKAALEGRWTDAFKAAQDRIMSQLLSNEAKKLERERETWKNFRGKMSRREVTGVAQDWLNWIHDGLLRAEAATSRIRSPDDLAAAIQREPSGTFLDFAIEKEKQGWPIMAPDFMYTDWHKPIDQMTVDEWRDYTRTMKNLAVAGREEKKFKVGQDEWDLDQLKEKMNEQMAERKKVLGAPKVTSQENRTRLQKMVGDIKHIAFRIVQMESIWNQIDLGNPYGIFNRSFAYRASDAANEYSVLVKEFSDRMKKELPEVKDLDEKLDPLFIRPSTRTIDNPDGEKMDMRRRNLIGVMRNIGTDSNLDKLVRGYWPDVKKDTPEYNLRKQSILNWVTRNARDEDWDFIQKEGKITEAIFDRAEQYLHNMGFVPPERVPLRKVMTAKGEIDGWFHPMIYDQIEEGTSKKLMGKVSSEVEGLDDSGIFRATTPQGWAKQRTGYAAPVYLGMDRSTVRLTSVLRDIAFRPFIVDASKLFYDKDFRAQMLRNVGEVQRDMLDPFLKALGGVGTSPMSKADAVTERILEFYRRNLISQLIGGNIRTLEKHTTSAAINSVAEVGPINFAREMRYLFTTGDLHPTLSNWGFAMKTSEELKRRVQNATQTVGGQYERIISGNERDFRDWLYEKGTAPIGLFDLMSAVPTWLAKYRETLEDAPKKLPDLQDARGLANDLGNRAVRRAHGSAAISSRPEAMRGNAMGRMFTSLYGFFNQALQRNYEAMWRTKVMAKNVSEGEFQEGAKQIGQVGKLIFTGVIAPALVEELVTPYTNHDRDSWGLWAAKTLINGASGTIPIVRELARGMINGAESAAGLAGTEFKELSDFYRDISKGSRALDNQHGGQTLKAANAVFSLMTGWSNNEIGNLFKTGWDVSHRSKETPRSGYELGRDMMLGHPREKTR